MHQALVEISYWWIIVYVVAALMLLVQELFSITMPFCRRQFVGIVVCLAALSGLYLLYCGQDPAQVYQFYSYDYVWNKGIGYLQYAPTIAGYVTIVVVNVICGVLGTIIGGILPFDTTGIDFAMTSLFTVIFVEQWQSTKCHIPALMGLAAAAVSLAILGPDNFILPAMLAICVMLVAMRGRLAKEVA